MTSSSISLFRKMFTGDEIFTRYLHLSLSLIVGYPGPFSSPCLFLQGLVQGHRNSHSLIPGLPGNPGIHATLNSRGSIVSELRESYTM